jgi:hypothetical protein
MTFPSKHLSVSINRRADQVYEFAANPQTWPQWAAGLSGSIQQIDGEWLAESPMGQVRVKFSDRNPYGVLDHEVTLPSGETVYNPLRVLPNQDGSEVVFTLFRRPEMTDQQFAEDAQAVTRDLETLKTLLES